jgi:glycerol-3-phosphate dehydrogenase (NAD(P)+)
MIGKGYSVKAAQLELNMVAEGYNASKCIFEINQAYGAEMPIATAIYQILWKHVHAANGFAEVEKILF